MRAARSGGDRGADPRVHGVSRGGGGGRRLGGHGRVPGRKLRKQLAAGVHDFGQCVRDGRTVHVRRVGRGARAPGGPRALRRGRRRLVPPGAARGAAQRARALVADGSALHAVRLGDRHASQLPRQARAAPAATMSARRALAARAVSPRRSAPPRAHVMARARSRAYTPPFRRAARSRRRRRRPPPPAAAARRCAHAGRDACGCTRRRATRAATRRRRRRAASL
ncbi:penicillin-binding protein [Gracilaria domingensis]|nr:penicillin-binding protein [Gracilaria domingensis]